MRERNTVRILLIGPDKRLLLLRFHEPRMNGGVPFWATVGGGVDPGESLAEAARREILEETGLSDLTLGPIIWKDDVVIVFDREPWFFHETYIVAHAQSRTLNNNGWTELERQAIQEMRWWTVAEIAAADEQIYPELLAEWLPGILEGRYPTEPREIPRKAEERQAPPGLNAGVKSDVNT